MGKASNKRTQPDAVDETTAKKMKHGDVQNGHTNKLENPAVLEFAKKFKTPEDGLQYLLRNAKVSVDEFVTTVWSKKPLYMAAEEKDTTLVEIAGYDHFMTLMKEFLGGDDPMELIPERDFLFSKVVNGKMDSPDLTEDLTLDTLKEYMDKKYAFQFHQPQRFNDALWSLMEKLECSFGSLVAAKYTFCPEKVQAMPPIFEDVENFVLQLEGSQKVSIYKPRSDLTEPICEGLKDEDLGEAILEETLKGGDVLYIPRDHIFKSESVSRSVCVTLSTFQNQTYGALIGQTVGMLLEKHAKAEGLYKGLPLGYPFNTHGVTKELFANALVGLAEAIKKESDTGSNLPVPEDLLSQFMVGRLPPYGWEPEDDVDNLKPLSKDDKISIPNKYHIVYYVRSGGDEGNMDEEMEEDEAEEELEEENLEKKQLVVMSSMSNARMTHMTIDANILYSREDAFAGSAQYEPVMKQLMEATEPIAIKDLKVAESQEKPRDIMLILKGLQRMGLLEVASTK